MGTYLHDWPVFCSLLAGMLLDHVIFLSQLSAHECLMFGSEWSHVPPDCKTTRPLRRMVPLHTLYREFFPEGIFPRLGMMLICYYRYVYYRSRPLGPLLITLFLTLFSLLLSSFLLGAPFQSPIRLVSPVSLLQSSAFTPVPPSTHLMYQGKSALPCCDG